jgi:hypothetical protein
MLNEDERNYCITWQELLAIVSTEERFHKYLYRQEFHLHTDHSAVTWLMSFKNLRDKPLAGLSTYESTTSIPCTVKAENNNANALS